MPSARHQPVPSAIDTAATAILFYFFVFFGAQPWSSLLNYLSYGCLALYFVFWLFFKGLGAFSEFRVETGVFLAEGLFYRMARVCNYTFTKMAPWTRPKWLAAGACKHTALVQEVPAAMNILLESI